MNNAVDVVIVGGGPGGLFLAARLARKGVRTLLFEEHARVGDPEHCTGVLSANSFDEFDLPRGAMLNELTRVRFVSPGGIAVEHATPSPLAIVIDRPMFDRELADRAVAAGAEVRCGSRVSAIEVDRDGAYATAGLERVHARLVVLASGANYAFQRRFGLGLPRGYLHTAQRELPASELSDVELHFGREVAPEGFAWAVPVVRPYGRFVRVGVMAARDALGCYARMIARVGDRWGIGDRELPPSARRGEPVRVRARVARAARPRVRGAARASGHRGGADRRGDRQLLRARTHRRHHADHPCDGPLQ
jgi:flavin-dependent dehydrogenase